MKPRAALCALAVAGAVVSSADDAGARPSESGVYTEAGLGASGFVGQAAAHARVGPAASLRVGYDVLPWLSAGGALAASTHEATVPPPPEGEHLQIYDAAAELRLAPPVSAFVPYLSGGAGVSVMSTNVLEKVGMLDPEQRASPRFHAGGGLEYQLQDRHYAFGVGADWSITPRFGGAQSISGRAFIRYTY